jgi:hypothetical protein
MLTMLDTMYLCTISCLQNTLIYIIIVCKQTSALHIINPRIYYCLIQVPNCPGQYRNVQDRVPRCPGPEMSRIRELLVRSGSESLRFLV